MRTHNGGERRMGWRGVRGAALLAMLLLASAAMAPAGEAPPDTAATTEALVEEVLAGNLTPDRRAAIVDELGRGGDETVTAVLAAFQDPNLYEENSVPLVQALGHIETEAAVRVLRAVLACAIFIPSDVTDAPALVNLLHGPVGGDADATALGRIRARLPEDIRPLLAERAKALAEAGEDDASVPPAEVFRIVDALNDLFDLDDLYDRKAYAGVSLPVKTKDLLSRHKPGVDEAGHGLSPLEKGQLNRLLIETVLAAAVQPAPRLFVLHYNEEIGREGLIALASNKHPHAQELMLLFRPFGLQHQKAHIAALREVEDPRAVWTLADYLIMPDRALSGLALRELMRRRDAAGVENAVERAFDTVERGGETEYPDHVIRKVIQAGAALPDTGDAADIVGEALSKGPGVFRDAALAVVSQNAPLLAERDALNPVYGIAARRAPNDEEPFEGELTETQLKTLLEGIRRYRVERALPVVALGLTSRYREVRMLACDIMGDLTDQNFGRNPVKWEAWYREQGR